MSKFRKILVDTVSDASLLITEPDCEKRVARIPRANDNNEGKTGLVVSGDRIESKQEIEIEIQKSGQFLSSELLGSRFITTPISLEKSGVGIYEYDPEPMGCSRPLTPGSTKVLSHSKVDYFYSPVVLQLKSKKNLDNEYYSLIFIVKGSGTSWSIEYAYMGKDYRWSSLYILDIALGAYPQVPSLDVIELEDGTIFVYIIHNNHLNAYRIFDNPGSFSKMTELENRTIVLGGQIEDVAVELIGSRIVVVYIYHNSKRMIGIFYSDDYGFTWIRNYDIWSRAGAYNAQSKVDLVLGQDKKLYLCVVDDDNINKDIFVISSSDGINWDVIDPGDLTYGLTTMIHDSTLMQETSGSWIAFQLIDETTSNKKGTIDVRWTKSTDPHHVYNPASTGRWDDYYRYDLGSECCESGSGIRCDAIKACQINDSGFIDLVGCYNDFDTENRGGVVVWRLKRWDSFVPDEDEGGVKAYGIDKTWRCWTPIAYPSVSDIQPNLSFWTRVLDGGCTSVLSLNALELTTDVISKDAYYHRTENTLDIQTNGIQARFALSMGVSAGPNNQTVVMFCASSPSGNECRFYLKFDFSHGTTGRIFLYNDITGSVVSLFTPGSWDIKDYNEYVVRYKDGNVKIYRCGNGMDNGSYYSEFYPFENILSGSLTNISNINPSYIRFGQYDNVLTEDGTKVNWHYFHFKFYCENINLYTDVNFEGRLCTNHKYQGLYQGMSAKFYGEYSLAGDQWVINTGGVYDPRNIFKQSPRIKWKEPRQSILLAGNKSPERIFEWRRSWKDDAGVLHGLPFEFNAIAIFGISSPYIKLYGDDFIGSSPTLLLNVPSPLSSGSRMFSGMMKVSSLDSGIMTVGVNTSNWGGVFIHNQYASNDYREWYVLFRSGVLNGFMRKIVGNTATKLYVESNIQEEGVLVDDTFMMLSDRFFHIFNTIYSYPRLKLCVNNGSTVHVNDGFTKIGTVIIGKIYDLPDDEWMSNTVITPSVNIGESRGGLRQYIERGQERRSIDLSYSGVRDRGMCIDKVKKLYEFCRWGVYPIVWVDHSDYMTTIGSLEMDHTEPILANMVGGLSHTRKSYDYINQDGVNQVVNINDITGITFDEVL